MTSCLFFRLATMTFAACLIGKKGSDLLYDLRAPMWLAAMLCGISAAAVSVLLWTL